MKKGLTALGIVLLLASVARGDGIYNPGGSAVSIPNYTANSGLPKWKACRDNKVKANTGNCLVPVLGESTPRGYGAMFSVAANDAASGAWPTQVAVQLKQIYGINAQSNSISGSGNTGNMAAFVAYDTRVVAANAWTVFSAGACTGFNLYVGSCAFGAASNNTTALQINPKNTTTYPSAPTVPTNVADIYSANVNLSLSFGDLSVKVNGGSTLATITQSGAGATTYTKTTVSTGSAAADNRWDLACTSAANGCLFDTIVMRNSAVSEASFINMGIAGATAGLWATTGNIWNPITAIQSTFLPDLCIIQVQGNDQDVGTLIATYKSNLHSIIAACQASGDVLIVTSQQGLPLSALSAPVTNSTLTCAANVVTTTTSSPHGMTTGNTPWLTVAGVTPAGYNGSYQITVTGASTFTYAIGACPGAETVPGTSVVVVPPYDNQATYAAAAVAQAAADGAPVLDWWTTMCGTVAGSGTSSTCSRGGWTAGVANGWNGSSNGAAQDIVHQGPYAYGPLAAQISQILMQ